MSEPPPPNETLRNMRESFRSPQRDETLRETIDRVVEQSDQSSAKTTLEGATKIGNPDAERNFYVAITIYGGAFVTGLFLLGESSLFSSGWWYGLVYTIGGGLGTMTVTPLFRPKLDVMRSSRSLWAAAAATWLLLATNIGFSIYGHFWSDTVPSFSSPEKWLPLTPSQADNLAARVRFVPPEEIIVACETINCKDLADGIADALQKTPGWKVSILHRGGLDISGVTGIQLNPNEPATQALRDAIEATTGLAVTLGPDTRKDVGGNQSFLVVGTKPF